jgi:hypothetical protein
MNLLKLILECSFGHKPGIVENQLYGIAEVKHFNYNS